MGNNVGTIDPLLTTVNQVFLHPFTLYVNDIQGWDPFDTKPSIFFPRVGLPLLCQLILSRV